MIAKVLRIGSHYHSSGNRGVSAELGLPCNTPELNRGVQVSFQRNVVERRNNAVPAEALRSLEWQRVKLLSERRLSEVADLRGYQLHFYFVAWG